MTLKAPFPWFGGKRKIAPEIWDRFGIPTQYIEPFCGSAAMLLAAPKAASLEVVCDANGFIANFWRAVKNQPRAVAEWADYPVSHIDLGARHIWLSEQRATIAIELLDANWPGDAKVAGWWLWGQCSWIGSGWCEWTGAGPARQQRGHGHTGSGEGPDATSAGMGIQAAGQVPHAGDAGMGIQAAGKVPHASDAGMGIQAAGQVPHASDAGRGIQAAGQVPHASDAGRGYEALLTSSGRAAWVWLHKLADRLERVRVVHGDWSRCLNSHYGGNDTAVFLDPPYLAYERLYGTEAPVAKEVAEWAREHPTLRIALCGHAGDYDLPGWEIAQWSRSGNTYGSDKTKDEECVWYSPGCLPKRQPGLFE